MDTEHIGNRELKKSRRPSTVPFAVTLQSRHLHLPTQLNQQARTPHLFRQLHKNTRNNTNIHTMDSAGAKSTLSRDMEELTQGKEEISHSVQGHKANLANPSMSCTAHSQLPLVSRLLPLSNRMRAIQTPARSPRTTAARSSTRSEAMPHTTATRTSPAPRRRPRRLTEAAPC